MIDIKIFEQFKEELQNYGLKPSGIPFAPLFDEIIKIAKYINEEIELANREF